MSTTRQLTGLIIAATVVCALPGAAIAKPTSSMARATAAAPGAATFSFGQPQSTTVGAKGCGTNPDGEPAIHVSRANDVFFGSERGVGSGSDAGRTVGRLGGPGASAGGQAEYRGQPNAFGGLGASGGDIDVAI